MQIKTFFAVAVAAGSCLPIAVSAQTTLPQADVAAIRQSVLSLMDATNNNPMATLSEYVQNSRVTSVNDETIVQGWDRLVEQTRTAQAGAFSIQAGNLDLVGMGPDHALVIAPFTMYYRTANGVVTAPGSMTLAYERTAAGWKIVHEHYSQGLDDQTKQRLSQAAAGRAQVTPTDVLRLLLAGLGGGSVSIASELLNLLSPNSCTR